MEERLIIRGAREHNLQNIDVELPRNRMIVVTGISGSGKSSLAFDTIYAEGQRRYVESLSAYARQFLGVMEKPDVDIIEGLSPAISIEQRTTGRNPRSTVGTVTEVYDYLRLLWARVGTPHCHNCGRPVQPQTAGQIADRILTWPDGARLEVLAPLVRGRKGEFKDLFEEARKKGFVRVRVDGETYDLEDPPELNRYENHTIAVVVDRLKVKADDRPRLADSVETALNTAEGIVEVVLHGVAELDPDKRAALAAAGGTPDGDGAAAAAAADGEADTHAFTFSERFACVHCGTSVPELEPRQFSFNSPYGACDACGGLGTRNEVAADLVVADHSISILEGVIIPWGAPSGHLRRSIIAGLAEHYDFDANTPWGRLPEETREIILYGSGEDEIEFPYKTGGKEGSYTEPWEGVVGHVMRRYEDTGSENVRKQLREYMVTQPCRVCEGHRLRPESLAVTVAGHTIGEVADLSVAEALELFQSLALDDEEPRNPDALPAQVARPILKEVTERLRFLTNVGLEYLTLGRSAETLAGGEAQRIRLATQIGSRLVGVLYILDEPSIGLHQRDNERLLATLRELRDLGNTVIVVEHDEETIRQADYVVDLGNTVIVVEHDEETLRQADYVVDLGPGAGRHGGELVAAGQLEDLLAAEDSITGAYLRGDKQIDVPTERRTPEKERYQLVVRGARQHNLKDIDVHFPLGTFTCVTGVSGSGKSTLINDIVYEALAKEFYRRRTIPGDHDGIDGIKYIDKVIDIDQSPIGRTPRSNPATYTGVFTPIRNLFAELPESKIRGYEPGRFSFNVKGGRCEACSGDGLVKIEMHFLPDVYIPCEVCRGKRYNRETLEVLYKGKNIADVLDMTVDEALEFFDAVPPIKRRLQTLSDVGLGYIHLGQSATTLSGGEAQRVKLATELAKQATGQTLYMLDEPTTGLHFEDIRMLLNVLHRLVEKGNTVIVIEHNMDVIKTADWIVDLGPEGGAAGGYIVVEGTPEEVAENPVSHTGRFLADVLGMAPVG